MSNPTPDPSVLSILLAFKTLSPIIPVDDPVGYWTVGRRPFSLYSPFSKLGEFSTKGLASDFKSFDSLWNSAGTGPRGAAPGPRDPFPNLPPPWPSSKPGIPYPDVERPTQKASDSDSKGKVPFPNVFASDFKIGDSFAQWSDAYLKNPSLSFRVPTFTTGAGSSDPKGADYVANPLSTAAEGPSSKTPAAGSTAASTSTPTVPQIIAETATALLRQFNDAGLFDTQPSKKPRSKKYRRRVAFKEPKPAAPTDPPPKSGKTFLDKAVSLAMAGPTFDSHSSRDFHSAINRDTGSVFGALLPPEEALDSIHLLIKHARKKSDAVQIQYWSCLIQTVQPELSPISPKDWFYWQESMIDDVIATNSQYLFLVDANVPSDVLESTIHELRLDWWRARLLRCVPPNDLVMRSELKPAEIYSHLVQKYERYQSRILAQELRDLKQGRDESGVEFKDRVVELISRFGQISDSPETALETAVNGFVMLNLESEADRDKFQYAS